MNSRKIDELKRILLMRRLKEEVAPRLHQEILAPIDHADRSQPLPLSWSQQRLWFLDQLQSTGAAYHINGALRLQGSLDQGVLQSTLETIVSRHEILRTVFVSIEGVPVQKIVSEVSFALQYSDLSARASVEREAEMCRQASEEAQIPFNFATGPLIRGRLIRLAEDQHILYVTMHHIISDGWSIGVLIREVAALYTAFKQGGSNPLSPLDIQYADYAQWQRRWLADETLQNQLAYWKQLLGGAPALLNLPTDNPRPTLQTFRGDRLSITLSTSFASSLGRFAREKSATTFMIMLAVLKILLFRWTNQTDIVIGTVTAGRSRSEIESLIGCFMNFIPLRNRIPSEQTANQFLKNVSASTMRAYTYQDCPFDKIVESLNPIRDPSHNPVFNVAFLLQNFTGIIGHSYATSRAQIDMGFLKAEVIDIPLDVALLDMRFVAEEHSSGIAICCEYNTDLFHVETIRLLLDAYQQSLEQFVNTPDTIISSFVLPQALIDRAQAARQRDKKQNIAIAATFTADPLEESLAFWMHKLGKSADIQFAAYNQVFQELLSPSSLFARNQEGVNVVLIRFEDWGRFNNSNTVETYPHERFEQNIRRNTQDLIHALQTAVKISSSPLFVIACPASGMGIVDSAQMEILDRMEALLADQVAPMHDVYFFASKTLQNFYPVSRWDDCYSNELGHVPYTAEGFTALASFVARQTSALTASPYKVVVLDCDQTLWQGICGEEGPQCVVLDAYRKALQEFMVRQYDAGMLLCLCSKNNEEDVWNTFVERPDFPLQRHHLTAWRINWQAKSENLHSLAEELGLGLDSFIFIDDNPVECAEVQARYPEVLTLQLPRDITQIPHFLQHVWAFDHIEISADAKQRTVLYQKERERETARRNTLSFADFLSNLAINVIFQPLNEMQLERVAELTHRTNQFNLSTIRRRATEIQQLWQGGQLVCMTLNVSDRFGDYGLTGAVFYVINGTVLELDTLLLSCRVLGKGIEHRLINHLAKIAHQNGCDLIAAHYIRSSKNQPIFNFLNTIAQGLPTKDEDGYLFTISVDQAAAVCFEADVQKSPFDQTGKFPRDAVFNSQSQIRVATMIEIATMLNRTEHVLEHLAYAPSKRDPTKKNDIPPKNRVENMVAEIWADILRIDKVGRYDNFFELGGNSLLAVKLYGRVKEEFGLVLTLSQIFASPTLTGFAKVIDEQSVTAGLLVPLRSGEKESPLVLVHPAGGTVFCYTKLASQMRDGCPVYAIQSPEIAELEIASYNFDTLCQRYLAVLVALHPTGSLRLAGWSLGGLLAFRIAEMLEAEGRYVEWVGLFDAGLAATEASLTFEDFLAWVFQRLQAEELELDVELTMAFQRAQRDAASHGVRFAQMIRDDPLWLERQGVDRTHLDFLRKQHWIQQKHSALYKEFDPGIIDAPVHVVWAEDSLEDGDIPKNWLALTRGAARSTQCVLRGTHTNVILLEENIREILANWDEFSYSECCK